MVVHMILQVLKYVGGPTGSGGTMSRDVIGGIMFVS